MSPQQISLQPRRIRSGIREFDPADRDDRMIVQDTGDNTVAGVVDADISILEGCLGHAAKGEG